MPIVIKKLGIDIATKGFKLIEMDFSFEGINF